MRMFLGALALLVAVGVGSVVLAKNGALDGGNAQFSLNSSGKTSKPTEAKIQHQGETPVSVKLKLTGPSNLKGAAVILGCSDCTKEELDALNRNGEGNPLMVFGNPTADNQVSLTRTLSLQDKTYTVHLILAGGKKEDDTGAKIIVWHR